MANCSPKEIPLGIGDACVPLHSHLACFWETESDFAQALGFLEEGLKGTDHVVIFGHDKANREVCRILDSRGFDLQALQAGKRLCVIGAAETGDALLESIAGTFSAQLAAGATVLRLFGNIGWLEQGWPKVAELIAMEAKVTVAADQFPCVILCMYDLRAFPALILRHGALESHALTIHDGCLRTNPYFVPSDTALRELDTKSEIFAQLECQLRESTERFLDLVEGLDAIVWEADADSFQFSFVSGRAEAILGYPVSQWLSEPNFWADHIHPEDRAGAVELCRLATSEGRDHRFTYRAIAADGRTVWLRDHARVVTDPKGRVRQLRGVMIDISESMALQESLRGSEARFRSTFEGAGIGMALVDREGLPVQTNPALQAMLGYRADKLAGLTFSQLTHPDDVSLASEKFQELMSGGVERFQMEQRLIRKDGELVWVLLTASLVRDLHGTPAYAVAMVEDITERRKGEAEITQLLSRVQQDAAELEQRVLDRTAQLEEINAELDGFAYTVSHDLRAPLRAIQGFAELLLENRDKAGDPERVVFLERIVAAAANMDQLIQDLLAYSRLSRTEIQLQPVSLEKVLQEAEGQLQLAGGGAYRLEVVGNLPQVLGHHAVLVQVVLNLLTNAIKFVRQGETPELRVWAERAGAGVRLMVQDNGIGIAPEHQEQIFKLFERLHGIESYPGTGIGLAMVKKAMTRLGGRIGVESRAGEGSRFWIELPEAPAITTQRPNGFTKDRT